MEMGTFSDVHNCGSPTEHCPVNLYFKLNEPYIVGYSFYVDYHWGKWNIDYTIDKPVEMRTDMKSIRGIKTDKEMYSKVREIIKQVRVHCGTTQ